MISVSACRVSVEASGHWSLEISASGTQSFVVLKADTEGDKQLFFETSNMAFTFVAFCYLLAMILGAVLIFFAIFHVSIIK